MPLQGCTFALSINPNDEEMKESDMKDLHFMAVDLGATSGRTIVATLSDGRIRMEEATRFGNPIIEANGHLYWDIYALYAELLEGLTSARKKGIGLHSIGIDTWGVDFVFVGRDGELLRNPYCYRDPHTIGAPERFFKRMPREELYRITGIQIMDFNSLFQLDTLHENHCSALACADKLLFMPDALAYMLTGNKVTEYTIASTAQLVNACSRQLEPSLIKAVGMSEAQFAPFVFPGTQTGTLSAEVQQLTGCGAVPVIAVAGHDTASAVAAVPASTPHFAYLSSGTWSLMGIETAEPIITQKSYEHNFTNEGGVEGTIRFLKNICGMWLLERCRKEWEAEEAACSYDTLIQEALDVPGFRSLINPDAPCFANPPSMTEAIRTYCHATHQPIPRTRGELVRCIFDSLAMRYRQVFGYLQELAPWPIECLHIIGGGARNHLLNQFTCNAVGIPVIAGPSEATALGNVLMQIRAAGIVSSLKEMRELAVASADIQQFEPKDRTLWEEGYGRYLQIDRENI